MNTTKILGEAVGIQSQGTVDKTETQTKEGLTSALIVGRFKRGRVDKPMTIHQGNIRGQLGYEPTNIDYQAVQDCLDTGVPSVQVLRVGQMIVDVDPEFPHTISCEGATNTILIPDIVGQYHFTLNDAPLTTASAEEFKTIIEEDSELSLLFAVSTVEGALQITNISSEYQRFGLLPFEPSNPSIGAPELNPSAHIVEYGKLTFCLSPTP